MLVMYNRYHNYVATQLRRINENGRFEVPKEYREHIEVARELKRKSLLAMPPPDDGEPSLDMDAEIQKFEEAYAAAWKKLDDDLFGTARL